MAFRVAFDGYELQTLLRSVENSIEQCKTAMKFEEESETLRTIQIEYDELQCIQEKLMEALLFE